MKRKFDFSIAIIIVIFCQAMGQVKPINNIPLFEFGGKDRQIAHFIEPNITDSIRVLYTVSVRFKYPLSDTTKKNEVISVEMIDYTLQNLGKNQDSEVRINAETLKDNNELKSFWERYSNYIINWYKKLPYQTMYGISQYPNPIKFNGVFILQPEQNESTKIQTDRHNNNLLIRYYKQAGIIR